MYRTFQLVLVGIVAMLFVLSALSRRFPQVPWLRLFRYGRPELSDEQRARIRRRSNVHAGIELILLGIVVPFGYFALTLMMFNEPTVVGTTVSLASSVLLIGLGFVAIWTNRGRPRA
jgi:hypothetical protein